MQISLHEYPADHWSQESQNRKSFDSKPNLFYNRCMQRQGKRFCDFFVAAETCRVMARQATWSDALVMAWTLMPNHYHALIQLGDKTSLQNVMKRANSVLAITTNRASCRNGQVWQPAYYDRALRDDEQVKTAARYLIANALRANIVTTVGSYSFLDAIWLSHNPEDIVL